MERRFGSFVSDRSRCDGGRSITFPLAALPPGAVGSGMAEFGMAALAAPARRAPWRWLRWLALTAACLVPGVPSGRAAAAEVPGWAAARWDSAGLAPDPATTPEPVIQFYAARTWGWRGVLGVHSWVAFKPRGAAAFTRYEVVGFGVGSGVPAIRKDRHPPDGYWAGNRPVLLADRRGAGVDEMIERLRQAVATYPFPSEYRLWPGPNSNTFTAHLARAVPEMHVILPPTAIGKDYLEPPEFAAFGTGGTGVQLSLAGLLGLTIGWREGVELNLLGLVIGLDVARPALKLPGVGRLGVGD
jgi:hypothetical protein